MLLNNQPDSQKRIEFVSNVLFQDPDDVPRDPAKPYATPWIGDDEYLMRFLYVPEGMSAEQARKVCEATA